MVLDCIWFSSCGGEGIDFVILCLLEKRGIPYVMY